MSALLWLEQHGPVLLLGVTIVLAGGLLALRCTREVRAQQRLGVLTGVGCLCYLAAALVPLPRWSLPEWSLFRSLPGWSLPSSSVPATASLRAAPVPVADAPPPAAAEPRRESLEERLALAPPAEPAPMPPAPPAWNPPAATADDHADLATAGPEPARDAPFRWATALAAIWAAGAALSLLRLLLGLANVQWLLRRSTAAPPWLADAPALPPGTRVLLAQDPVRPFCTGVLRPVIVLPREFAERQRAAQAIALLRHEAAHVQARDTAVQWLFAWLSVPLFCHPLFWLLRARVRFAAELLADDAAARPGVHAYVHSLLDLADGPAPAIAADTAVSVFQRRSEFYRRIQMLLQREAPLSSSPSRLRLLAQVAFTAALVATSAGLFGAPLRAQDPGPAAAAQTTELRATIKNLHDQIAELQKRVVAMSVADSNGATAQAPIDLQTLITGVYTVQPGDSLEKITRNVYGRHASPDQVNKLRQANPDLDPTRLRVGEKVQLPAKPPAADYPPPQDPIAQPPAASPNRYGYAEQDPFARQGRTQASTTEGIADLATRYLDLQGEVESTAIEAEEQQRLGDSGVTSMRGARQAQIRADVARRKFAVIERLLRGEITSLEAEMVYLEAQIAQDTEELAGRLHRAQLMRARANLEALHSVLSDAAPSRSQAK